MDRTCQDCRHFRRHYIKRGNRYQPIGDGHCVYPRLKRRKDTTPACGHFVRRETAQESPPGGEAGRKEETASEPVYQTEESGTCAAGFRPARSCPATSERLNGFAESDVYLVDAAGNIVADLGGRFYETSDKAHLEDAILLFYHHARFAAEELTGTDYTLVIPSVTYLEKKTGLFHTETTPVEIQGPFEIPIRLP